MAQTLTLSRCFHLQWKGVSFKGYYLVTQTLLLLKLIRILTCKTQLWGYTAYLA